jgi:hypothetical protein
MNLFKKEGKNLNNQIKFIKTNNEKVYKTKINILKQRIK